MDKGFAVTIAHFCIDAIADVILLNTLEGNLSTEEAKLTYEHIVEHLNDRPVDTFVKELEQEVALRRNASNN